MYIVDPNNTWRPLEKILEGETDPIRRRNLEHVINHGKWELTGNLDPLIDSMSDHVEYTARGPRLPGMEILRGKDGVRTYYEGIASSGIAAEAYPDVVVIDENHVVTEGPLRLAFPGGVLASYGISVDEIDAFYLFETRLCVIWPFDEEGKLLGEQAYFGSDGFEGISQRKLDASMIAPILL